MGENLNLGPAVTHWMDFLAKECSDIIVCRTRCSCTNAPGSPAADSLCSTPCPGDPSDKCGDGDTHYSVFGRSNLYISS